MPTLEQALAYQNDEIPLRFLDEWSIELADARLLFDDVKRWLYLCQHDEAGEFTIHGPLIILDEMWHNFVLFTREYAAYCDEVYGGFQHHGPTTQRDAQQMETDFATRPDETRRLVVERRARQRAAIVRHLGVETLLRWYVDYPVKYGSEFFATSRKRMRVDWQPDAALVEMATRLRGAGPG